MAIPAQRMQFLDKETNLGLIDPTKIKNNDILNVVTNQFQEITSGLSDFIKSVKQQVMSPISMLTNLLSSGVRLARDAFSAMADLAGMTVSGISSMISSMLPDSPAIQNAFRNISAQCRNKGLSTASGFKPYKDSVGCGKGQGVCNSSEIGGFLDKLTGGAASAITRSLNSMLKSILALGRMGFDAGMCKVFGELIKGMPANIVQRGAAGLLGMMGSNGNTSAVLDITANMGNAVPSLEIPGLVGIAMSNFTIPGNFSANTMTDLADGYFTAMDSIQPAWNESASGNMLSLANIGDKKSPDMGKMLEVVSSRNAFDVADMSAIVKNPLDTFTGAYKSTTTIAKSVSKGLSSLFA